MDLKFGTSGLRGLSVELLGKPSYVYAAAFADYVLEKGFVSKGDKVLVAYDFRDSSPAIASNAMRALRDHGLVPADCGYIPTPALAHYGLQNSLASLMITGSHIPADRNGIKFYLPDGEIAKHDEAGISAIAAQLMAHDVGDAEDGFCGEDISAQVVECFMARNRMILPENFLAGMCVGVYQHSTVARDMLVDTLRFYGADVLPLGRSETFIPVDTEAVSDSTLALLRTWSSQHGVDAIVSADGDGDRPLIAAENGVPINGDICGFITALHLGADAVVTPITSNSGIEQAGSVKAYRTKVGSPYVIEAMKLAAAEGAKGVVGFEANGGTLTHSVFDVAGGELAALPTRDSFLPILSVLAKAKREGIKLSQMKDKLGMRSTAADRLQNFAQEKSAAIVKFLGENEANISQFVAPLGKVENVDRQDGVRISLEAGRVVHFRPSGNAPEMRCYVEAKDDRACLALLHDGLELLRNFDFK